MGHQPDLNGRVADKKALIKNNFLTVMWIILEGAKVSSHVQRHSTAQHE